MFKNRQYFFKSNFGAFFQDTFSLCGITPLVVQSIYYFDPSLIATEGFSLPFISLNYADQHMKSLEKSKKGKIIFFFTETI